MNNAFKMAEIPLGTPADEVRKRWKKPLRTKDLGKDPHGTVAGVAGHVVEWEYPWGSLVFKRRRYGGARCYRVVEKRVKGV
jgi:hypothetical protein